MKNFTHFLPPATAAMQSPLKPKLLKKCTAFCLLLAACTALNAQAPGIWTAQGSGITASPRDFLGIDAVSPDVAWGVAEHPTFSVGAREFCRTLDGGATWQTGVIDPANGGLFTSLAIYALDAETAWVIMTSITGQSQGKIYKTTNGGQSWLEQTGSFNGTGNALTFIHFFDEDNGLAIGSPGTGNSTIDSLRIWKTSNGGDVWNRISPDQLPARLAGEGIWITSGNGHYAAIGDNIWFGTRRGRIWYSPDRGESWQVFPLSSQNITNKGFSVTFSDEQNGIAAGEGIAFRTDDGGQTWAPLTTLPASVVYYRVQHVPGSNGAYYLTYEASQSFYNDIRHAYSTDNGETWTLIADQPRLLPFEFVSPTVGWGGGDIEGPDGKGMYRWSGNLRVPNRHYVKADAIGANTGRSWEDAFTDLQDALAIAEPDDAIWVAQGLYTPAGPGGARTATFLVNKELDLYGGFAGTESSLDERGDPADHPTTLSGDLNGDDVNGELLINRTDNSYTIMTLTAAISTETTVDGFVFRSGHADGPGTGPDRGGAGLYNLGKPVINGCIFEQNYALSSGGGLSFASSTSGGEVINCIFRQNAANTGGGLSCFANRYQIEDCIFEDNFTFLGTFQAHGGGAYIVNGNGSIQNCSFNNNSSVASGGGIFKWCTTTSVGVSFDISNCTFQENSAVSGGGLSLVPWGDDAVYSVVNCRYEANNSSFSGGGLYLNVNGNASNFQLSVEDCHFEANQTVNNGSGSYVEVRGQDATIEIEGCEYTNNITENFSAAGVFWATGNGTGIALVDSCHFENNSSTYSGAMEMGVGYNGGGNFRYEITNSSFVSNLAMEGGGITLWTDQTSTGSFLVDNCLIDDNTATVTGGGILFHPQSTNFQATVKNTVITNNQSPDGSGIKAYPFLALPTFPANAVVHIENSLVSGNFGGTTAISAETAPHFSLLNVTVADNAGDGVEITSQTSLQLQNTILYNPGYVEFFASDNSSFTSLGGNLIGDLSLDGQLVPGDKQNLDPLFEGAGSFQLTLASPGVDAGVEAGVTAPFDLAGNLRIQGLRVDMGAYESPFTTSVPETAAGEEAALWPNPATEVLNIVLPGSETAPFEVQVFDAAGKTLLRRRLWPGQSLPLQGLSPGMYALKAVATERVYTGKIIKQ